MRLYAQLHTCRAFFLVELISIVSKTYRSPSQLSRWTLGCLLCLLTSVTVLADRTVNVPLIIPYTPLWSLEARGLLGREVVESVPTVVSRSPICWVQSAQLLMRYFVSSTEHALFTSYEGSGPAELGRKNRTGSSKTACEKTGFALSGR